MGTVAKKPKPNEKIKISLSIEYGLPSPVVGRYRCKHVLGPMGYSRRITRLVAIERQLE
jgi:hypothetical protein